MSSHRYRSFARPDLGWFCEKAWGTTGRGASTGRAGFTLLELLVTCAIILILAGLLLAGVQAAKRSVRQVICLNNKRQLGQAWHLYAVDNHGKLAPNSRWNEYIRVSDDLGMPNWVAGWMDWKLERDNTNEARLINLDQSALAPYSRSAEIFRCPEDRFVSALQRAAGWTGRCRSVAMNAHMGMGFRDLGARKGSVFPHDRRVYWRLSDFRQLSPARAWVIIDEHPDSIRDGYFDVLFWPRPFAAWRHLPASYHKGGTGLLFADGHSEIKRWKLEATKQPVRYEPWFDDSSRSPTWQSPLDDWRWLQDRTSESVPTPSSY